MKGAVLCYIAARVTPPGMLQDAFYFAMILCIIFPFLDCYRKEWEKERERLKARNPDAK